ncbi:hypothetical protein [uncultured Fretibacterium sp.]|mgnify:CR=1 FL=1|uniref:hypothetical protein n=1 Tax=uncultured Fretibacterium sp. TaxID=1678694 RepID=UPI0026317F5C|nr:hypothetical protein [uncultured Fretibacterium sp.]
MGGFLDFLSTVLTNLFGDNNQDDDLFEMHEVQDEACDYEPDVPDAYRYRH